MDLASCTSNSDLLAGTLLLLLCMVPAMVANGSPVVISAFLVRRGYRPHPIDGCRRFIDGRRILGDGKTFEGFIGGVLAGGLAGFILGIPLRVAVDFTLLGMLLGAGALIGDMIGSFIKRRLRIERGQHAPLLDEVDFYLGALLFLCLYMGCPGLIQTILVMIIIIILHYSTNQMARGMKSEAKQAKVICPH